MLTFESKGMKNVLADERSVAGFARTYFFIRHDIEYTYIYFI